MSCLFRRSNGIWYIASSNGKKRQWISCGTRSREEAQRIFKELPQRYAGRSPLRISDFWKEIEVNASTNYSLGTRNLYAHSIKKFIQIVGDRPMKFISVRDVEIYKTKRAQNVSSVSVNVEFRTLKAAFNTAMRWGIISENVFTHCKLLRIPVKEPAYLTNIEFNRLLNIVKESELREIFQFAACTMMRRGEIINLKWSDVDLQRRMVNIRNTEEFTVKCHRPRVVPMNKEVHQMLLSKTRNGPFVFEASPGKRFKGSYLSHKFKFYVRKCGLSKSLHFHSLRHTGATWLIQQDVPLYTVQKLLGHSSPHTTQIYSHIADDNLKNAVNLIALPVGSTNN